MAEIAMAVASKAAVEASAEASKPLLAWVRRQCGYVIFSKRYVGQLKDEFEKLNYARQRVQHSVDEARNYMRPIEGDVMNWLKEAETIANKARDVLDDDGRAKKTRFYLWPPNPKARYYLGRDARKTVQAIHKLIPQGRFERVYYENAPPGLVGGAAEVNSSACDGGDTIQEFIARGQFENPPLGRVDVASGVNSSAGDTGDFITGSRASIFQNMMKALDDENLKVIGVYGPGGVGKTTLLEEVEKKLRKEGRPFHMIVKSKASQTPDLKKIQDDIAYALGLNLKDKPSEVGRRDLLFQKLQGDPTKKVLVILDDLWEELDLRALGIPSGDESNGCQILLTSRYKNVLQQKMCACPLFHLTGLKDDEAFGLFEKKVGDRLKDNEELKAIAHQVVKKLAGLPLLIISVASILKSSDESAWRNALIELDESSKKIIEMIVRMSYEHLKSEDAKYLFLLCGLIGGTIQVELLFVLAMGLGLFKSFNKTIQASRDRLNNMLNELRSACLLLDGGDGKDKVTIHDLYSEVVVSTPFRDQNSLMINSDYGSLSKKKLEKYWAICLDDDVGRDRLAKLMPWQFPSLEILMLSMPKVWGWMQEPDVGDCVGLLDFTGMKELQVLYFRSMYNTNLPPSIKILGNLRSLYLDNCYVEDVAIIGKLKALEILSFAMSQISRLPKEMGELTNLRLLNLNYCRKLQRIEPGVLNRLIQLEELHMKGSFDRWMGKNEKPSELCNVGLAELRSMTKLNSLEISIRDPIILLEDYDLPFENLTRFQINIGNVVRREFKGLRTMKIKLEGHDSILSKTWVQKTLQKTQYLCLDGLGEFENAYGLCIRGVPQLKHLEIHNNPSIKYVISSSNSVFAILESLFLHNLINLENISHGHIVAEYFSKLKDVRVEKCSRLEYLWSLSHMQNIVQLETIAVWNCDSMRAIARKDIVPADCRVELSYLRHLYLGYLPNMRSFCSRAKVTSEGTPIQVGVVDEGGGDEGIELVTTTSDLQNTYSDSFFDRKASLPNLEKLKLNSVGSFKRIWHYELSRSSFCKLATITIKNCCDVLHIFHLTIIGRLHNLKSVEVNNCPSLKSLFDFGSLDSNTEQTTVLLPKLESINVKSCPSLESLFNCGSLDSNAKHKIILLPKLKDVRVSGAKKLRHVVMSHSQIVLGFPSLEFVSVKNCSDMRYLFSKYMATTLMKLKWLTISKCKQMKEVILEEEAGQSEAEVLSFPCLSRLTLKELHNLISFGSGSVKRQLGETTEENDESPQSLFNEMVTFPNMRYLKIEGVPCKELWNNHDPANSIVCSHQFLLGNVEVKNCPSLKSLFDFGSLDSNTEQNAVLLPKLVRIDVENCPSLESLFNCGSLDSNAEHKIILLPKLEEVRVSGAKKLRHVVMSHSQMVLNFPSLRTIGVHNCSHLRYLFSKYTATSLMKLKRLEISKCERMKEVILEEEVGRSEGEVKSFPCLSELTLEELDNFGAFISGPTSVKRQLGETTEENDELPQPLFNEMVTFPNITSLKIKGLRCKELWNKQIPIDSFQKLEYLKLKNCDNLQRIATSYMWKKLQSCLKKLKVISCHSIEIIYEGDGTDTESGKLRRLVLRDLENLRCIWQSNSLLNIPFPNLIDVEAVKCPHLEMLFPTFTAKFLEQIKELMVDSCEDMELIAGHEKGEEVTHTTITFSELTLLVLVELPKFKRFFLPEKYSMKFPCSEDFPSLQKVRIESCGAEPHQVLGYSEFPQLIGIMEMDSESDESPCDQDLERERGMNF